MKDQLVILKPKTKKGKDRINAAGEKWIVTHRKEKVAFDDRPGVWLALKNCTNFLDFRWVKLENDNDFEVEFIYRAEPNGSNPLERIRNLLSPFLCLADMVMDGKSDIPDMEDLKIKTASKCQKLAKEIVDHIENLENMERARQKGIEIRE